MKTLRFTTLMIITALMLTACGAKTPSAPERPPLKVAWSPWVGYYPLLIAQEKGFFKTHGVQVEPVQTDSAQAKMVAVTSGTVDGSLVTLTEAIQGVGESDLRLVMTVDASEGGDVVVAPADVASVADLKGKRVGAALGSFGELVVREMLYQNGMSVSDVQMVNVLPEQLPDALGSTVDAGHTYDPYTSQALSKGYKIIFSTAEAPTLILDVMAFRSTVVNERPDDVRAFVAAWFDAVTWWQANVEEGNALVAKLTNQKPEDISFVGVRLYTQADNFKLFDTAAQSGSIYESAQKSVDFYKAIGGLRSAVDLNKLLDGSFLK